MSFGDHWSEPARCGSCGQERSTHDDGECEARRDVRRMIRGEGSTMEPTKPEPIKCKNCGYEICKHPCAYRPCDAIRKTGFCGDPCKTAYQQEKDYMIQRAADGKL